MRSLVIALFLLIGIDDALAQSCGRQWLRDQQRTNFSGGPQWQIYNPTGSSKLHSTIFYNAADDRDYINVVKLSASRHYTILYYTGSTALASGLEILDNTAYKVKFAKIYGKSRNNWIEEEFQPTRTGVYTIKTRSIYPSGASSCSALLIREWDDQEWKERLKESGTDTND